MNLLDTVINSTENQVGVLAYGDDFSAAGKLDDLRKGWDTLAIVGPKFAYYPEPTKAWVVVIPYESQRTTNRFLGPKLRSPMKDTNTLEGKLAQINLKIPMFKKKFWNRLTSLKF